MKNYNFNDATVQVIKGKANEGFICTVLYAGKYKFYECNLNYYGLTAKEAAQAAYNVAKRRRMF